MDERDGQATVEYEVAPAAPARVLSWLGKVLPAVVGLVAMASMYFGGLALHVWTAYLFYKHWGGFWAILTFFMPPLGEAVTCFTCLSWGVWFYWLAIALYLVSLAGGTFLEAEEKPERRFLFLRLAILWLAVVTTLGVFFGRTAWRYAVAPTPMTREYRTELADTATAVVSVLRASTSDDLGVTSKLPDAKQSLRKQLGGLDKPALDTVCQFVDAYLVYERCFEDDLLEYLMCTERRAGTPQFEPSSKTKAALEALPDEMRTYLGDESKGFNALIAGQTRNPMPDAPAMYREGIAHYHEVIAQVYTDLLGRQSPPILNDGDGLNHKASTPPL